MADRNGYIGRAPSDSAVTVARQTFSPTGVTTNFTFASGYVAGYFDIFINGVKMIEGSDYTSTDGSTFSVLNGGAVSGDVIEGVAYKAFNAATATVGVNSAGTPIGSVNTLNFVGTGNTFALRGSSIDISISGGGAGAGGTWTNYDTNTGVSTTKKVKIENNLEVTGVTTSTGGFVGNVTGNATGITGTPDITVRNITGVAATFTGVLTYEDVTNIDSVGLVTARSGINIVGGGLTVTGVSTFHNNVELNANLDLQDDDKILLGAGDDLQIYHSGSHSFIVDSGVGDLYIRSSGGNIQDQGNANQSWLQFNSGAGVEAHFAGSKKLETTAAGVSITGTSTCTGSVQVGSGQSFGSSTGSAAVYYGDGSNLTNLPAAGLATAAGTAAGIVTTLFLSSAQDHKITASGITTITVSGGTESESHTVRIINSGITTVGFSTYFLFPSGSTPSLPTADGAISLISFTVNRVGTAGTQLLAGASVNYS